MEDLLLQKLYSEERIYENKVTLVRTAVKGIAIRRQENKEVVTLCT